MEEQLSKTLIESPYPFWLTVLLFSVISGFIQYLIAYYKEKGKNLAKKEDLVEITNKIKETETKFTIQTEQLKSQLSLLTNIKSEIYSTERNAIIDANVKLYRWLSHIMRLPILDNNDDIDRYINKMDELYNEEQASEALLELFIDDKAIIDNINNISIYIYNIHIEKQIILYKLQKQNSIPEIDKCKLNNFENETKNKFIEISDKYGIISPHIHKFRLDCKNYIYSKCLNNKPEI